MICSKYKMQTKFQRQEKKMSKISKTFTLIICWNITLDTGLHKILLTPRFSFCFLKCGSWKMYHLVCGLHSGLPTELIEKNLYLVNEHRTHSYSLRHCWITSTWRSLTLRGHIPPSFSTQLVPPPHPLPYVLGIHVNWYKSDFNVVISVIQMYHGVKEGGKCIEKK